MTEINRELVDSFAERFGRPPTVLIRAPGRVNLIGEHTDYNGLPVLPMAISRLIELAAAPREDQSVELANVDARFAPRGFELARPLEPYAGADWGNYAKAAVDGILGSPTFGPATWRGFEALVAGTIPRAAGLSSSSALVVAAGLATLATNKRLGELDRGALAELFARAERYVGTESGGMDQAVCLLAEEGSALRIDFDPLLARSVPLAPEGAFVVCDTLVAAEKAGLAREHYNRRVFECRLACRALERALDHDEPARHLGDLRRRAPDAAVDELLDALQRALPTPVDHAALAELAAGDRALERSVKESAPGESWPLLRRARHALTEGERVDQAEEALATGDLRAFGALMDASHASCRDDYEVSCAELEALVEAAKEAGALGARLTGAGFGGCTVNLVRAEAAERFVDELARRYYAPRGLEASCFLFEAAPGARVIELELEL